MDPLKATIPNAADANFIGEYRILVMTTVGLQLWDFGSSKRLPIVVFEFGQGGNCPIDPSWVILRNYEFDETVFFRANPESGIVGIFPKKYNDNPKSIFNMSFKSDPRGGFVIPIHNLSTLGTFPWVKWEDWSRFMTVLDPPKHYDLYVFHTHVLCINPLTLEYRVFDFSPYATRLNATTRGGPIPNWIKSLSEPQTLPTTFSGRVEGLKPGNSSTKYFPTENGILTIKVSLIPHGNKSY